MQSSNKKLKTTASTVATENDKQGDELCITKGKNYYVGHWNTNRIQ